jgi:hypothetical protein
MQVWKIHEIMVDRKHGATLEYDHHIPCCFNPIQHRLSQTFNAYRLPLQVSTWSEPQIIIDEWAETNSFSLVLEELEEQTDDGRAIASTWGEYGFGAFDRVFETELKNRFGLRYEPKRADLLGIDYGILDPRSELQDWE